MSLRGCQLEGLRRTARLIQVAQVAALAALFTAGGCGPQYTPHVLTYEADIRPLVLSRCVRCHGAGGTLRGDPTTTSAQFQGNPNDGYFDRFDDPPCADGGAGTCGHGMRFFATDTGKKALLTAYLHSADSPARMPPPPSPALTSIQLRTFHDWLAEDPPIEK